MTLSCLTCQTLQRTNSDLEDELLDPRFQRLRPIRNDRPNWSGCLVQQNPKKIMTKHKRGSSAAAVMQNYVDSEMPAKTEPRLLRSSGMRRDWSFEELMMMKRP